MLDTRERLARHLYGSALDLDPDGEIAIRFGHPDGCSWRVDADQLTVTFTSGDEAVFPLSGTLQALAADLTAAGFIVRYVNPDLMHLSVAALLRGSGNDASSAHDQLQVFRSDLWTMLDAYSVVVDQADRDIVEAIAQLYIGTADGEMLEYWGEYFGVPRNASEADDAYRTRIIIEVLRPKNNKIALENAASEIAGDRIEIYEPWTDLFRLSESRLDAQKMYDGEYSTPYVFRPVYRGYHNVDWSRILVVLNKLRPAGVLMLDPEWIAPVRNLDVTDHEWGLLRTEVHSHTAKYADKTELDHYRLSEPVILNYRIVWFDLIGVESADGVPEPVLPLSTNRHFVRAQIALSDGATLGDLRCRTAMSVRYALNRPVIDGLVTSTDAGGVNVAVEDVSWPSLGMSLEESAVSGFGLTGYELIQLAISAPIAGNIFVPLTVVTPKFLHAGINESTDSLARTWYGQWDAETWETAGTVKGICISVKTEIA